MIYTDTMGFPRSLESSTGDSLGDGGFSSVTRVEIRCFPSYKGCCHVGGAIRDNNHGLVSDPTPLPPTIQQNCCTGSSECTPKYLLTHQNLEMIPGTTEMGRRP